MSYEIILIGAGMCQPVECYPYMEDLELELKGICPSNHETPLMLAGMLSPLRTEEWANGLSLHPDKEFSLYVVRRICKGFRIGFGYQNHSCT